MSDGRDRMAAGEKIRREVLGSEHVDRSLGQVSDFSRPVQNLAPAALEAFRTAERVLNQLSADGGPGSAVSSPAAAP